MPLVKLEPETWHVLVDREYLVRGQSPETSQNCLICRAVDNYPIY